MTFGATEAPSKDNLGTANLVTRVAYALKP